MEHAFGITLRNKPNVNVIWASLESTVTNHRAAISIPVNTEFVKLTEKNRPAVAVSRAGQVSFAMSPFSVQFWIVKMGIVCGTKTM